MSTPIGHVSWNELLTHDAAASGRFYGALLGWQVVEYRPRGMADDAPPFLLFKERPDARGLAGMTPPPQAGLPAQWIPYIIVEEMDAVIRRAEGLGAKVLLARQSVGVVGWISVLQDPQGAVFGLQELPPASDE
jgi:hypothetical protein